MRHGSDKERILACSKGYAAVPWMHFNVAHGVVAIRVHNVVDKLDLRARARTVW